MKKLLGRGTIRFFREGIRSDRVSFFDILHGFAYTRWIYAYIRLSLGERGAARFLRPLTALVGNLLAKRHRSEEQDGGSKAQSLADGYHGKVVPLQAAAELVTLDREIRLTDLEKVIPYRAARDIILQDPGHLAVLECPCRAARVDPCTPLDVCLAVGEPFVGMLLEQQPTRSRKITEGEALEILRDEEARGHVHHAFFKDAMLGRFYAICNCCPCCCAAMQAQRLGTPMLAPSGYRAAANNRLCTGCGRCLTVCPFGALSMQREGIVVDEARCMGCGLCVSQCPKKAMTLSRDHTKGVPLEVRALASGKTG